MRDTMRKFAPLLLLLAACGKPTMLQQSETAENLHTATFALG